MLILCIQRNTHQKRNAATAQIKPTEKITTFLQAEKSHATYLFYYYFTIYPSFQHSFKRDVSHHVFLLNYLLDLCRGMLNSVLLGYHYNMKVCLCLHVYYMFYIPKNKRCRHLYVFVPRSNLANKGSNTFLYKLLEKLQGETTQFSSQFGGGPFVFY